MSLTSSSHPRRRSEGHAMSLDQLSPLALQPTNPASWIVRFRLSNELLRKSCSKHNFYVRNTNSTCELWNLHCLLFDRARLRKHKIKGAKTSLHLSLYLLRNEIEHCVECHLSGGNNMFVFARICDNPNAPVPTLVHSALPPWINTHLSLDLKDILWCCWINLRNLSSDATPWFCRTSWETLDISIRIQKVLWIADKH